MAATNLLGTLPDPNYWRLPMLQRRVRHSFWYRVLMALWTGAYLCSNGACDGLAQLVTPYSLSHTQLAEATGIADEATVNSWVEAAPPRPLGGCSRAPGTRAAVPGWNLPS